MLTKEELADKFVDAGYGKVSIDPEDLEVLGIKMQKTFKSKSGRVLRMSNGWESFCSFVYEKITGNPHPGCPFRGRGFRSQSFGKDIAKAIRLSSEKDAAAQVMADTLVSHETNPFDGEEWVMSEKGEEE